MHSMQQQILPNFTQIGRYLVEWRSKNLFSDNHAYGLGRAVKEYIGYSVAFLCSRPYGVGH